MPLDPKRVQDVFLAAVECHDAAARAVVLDRECSTDLELRQRVEALLNALDRPESLLDQPIVGPDGPGTAPPQDPVITVLRVPAPSRPSTPPSGSTRRSV